MTTISFNLSSDAERRLNKQTKQIYNLLMDAGADFTENEIWDALISGITRSVSTDDFKPEISEDGVMVVLEAFIKKYPRRVPESFRRYFA